MPVARRADLYTERIRYIIKKEAFTAGKESCNARSGIRRKKVLAAVSAYAVPVCAKEGREMPDLDAKGSISLTFSYYDESTGKTMPVADGNAVGLYKAAKVVVDNGFKYVVDDRFASVGGIPATICPGPCCAGTCWI